MNRLLLFQITSILPISALLLLSSCQQTSREKDFDHIHALEEQLDSDMQSGEISNNQMISVAQAMDDYVHQYPDDTIHLSEFYKKSAMLYGQAHVWDKSISLIDTFISRYPNHEYAPQLLHFKAFYIYEEGEKDLKLARKAYLQFLDLYPDNDLVKTVLFSLENLGKPADEVLDELIEKQR